MEAKTALRGSVLQAISHAPDNMALLPQRPYSPELNPTENVWQFFRHNYLSHRVFADYKAIVDACCDAWNKLTALPDQIRSIGTRTWATANN